MRLATFQFDGEQRLGLVTADDAIIDLALPGEPGVPPDLLRYVESPAALKLLRERAAAAASSGEPRWAKGRVRFLPPLARPGKLICLAGNYRDHITESGFVAPRPRDIITPQLFLKPSTSLIGDGADILLGRSNVRVGWEAELAVVIGRRGRHIAAPEAMDYVFGYTILNDISERKLNSGVEGRRMRESDPFFDWLAGKWFDGFAPCGPWVVTADEVADPHDLEIRLWVNGQLRQRGHTGDMIFRLPETIAYASSIMTLEPGDIISTGTPAGAGLGEGDTWLRDGDEVVCEIERIGRLRNRVRGEG